MAVLIRIESPSSGFSGHKDIPNRRTLQLFLPFAPPLLRSGTCADKTPSGNQGRNIGTKCLGYLVVK